MDDLFGAPTGKIGDSSISQLKNSFASIADRSVDSMAQTDRVIPRQVGTGNMRGTQRINNTDGSYLTLGLIPDSDGEFGIAFFDSDGNLVAKSTGVTDFKYDLETEKNYYQNGKLPDGSYGAIYAKSGYDVDDVIS